MIIVDTKQIGALLQGRRKSLGFSQTDLASRVDLSQNRLSELESRPETLTVEQLLALLNVLGIEMSLTERAAGKRKVEW